MVPFIAHQPVPAILNNRLINCRQTALLFLWYPKGRILHSERSKKLLFQKLSEFHPRCRLNHCPQHIRRGSIAPGAAGFKSQGASRKPVRNLPGSHCLLCQKPPVYLLKHPCGLSACH